MTDTAQNPNVLCLCATYRRVPLLRQALKDFLDQDYPAGNRRLLISDDAMEVYPQR